MSVIIPITFEVGVNKNMRMFTGGQKELKLL